MNTTKPIHKPGLTIKHIGDETLLHDSDDKAIHVLNPTAQLIWELCDGEHAPMDMESAIRTRFTVPDEHDVLGDIQRVLETFTAKGLLEHPE